jgi:hypothetical protein
MGFFLPSPLVGEGGFAKRRRVRGSHKLRAWEYPSSVAAFVRATFSHRGRRK